jgi:hypothetical protein
MTSLPHTLRLAAASLLILSACAGAHQSAPAPDSSTAGLWQQIQAANTNLGCDNDSQCHSIGVGAKSCGGPENYLAWSSKNSNGAKLKSLVELHSAARRADNNSQGMMSTCIAISDPGAVCRAGACVLNTRDVAPPPAK